MRVHLEVEVVQRAVKYRESLAKVSAEVVQWGGAAGTEDAREGVTGVLYAVVEGADEGLAGGDFCGLRGV